MRVVLSLGFALVLLAGCDADLGPCDMNAATQVVYSVEGTPYYQGQALVEQSCAGGFCHSASAVGANRIGAPHGVNFDADPLTPASTPAQVTTLSDGLTEIRDQASSMYDQIEDGKMPPGEKGKRPPRSWKLADGSPAPLPEIGTAEGKDAVRNWLACGAPAVAGVTGAPAAAATLGDVKEPLATAPVTATFASVYSSILSGTCITCHVKGGPFIAQTPLDFSTPASAFASLVSVDASATGSCSGKGKLVVPGNCEQSLLYQKLQPMPACGARMPLNGTPVADSALTALCDWIKAGAMQ